MGIILAQQRWVRAGLIFTLCACLASGQVVYATEQTAGDTKEAIAPYVEGSAAVFSALYETIYQRSTGNNTAAENPNGAMPTAGLVYVSSEEDVNEYLLKIAGEALAEAAEVAAEETERIYWEEDWKARGEAIKNFENLGICDVSSYVNVREKASTSGKIIGKMLNNDACEILSKTDDGKWYKIESGDVTGYVSSEYILTGQEAKDRGREEAQKRVIIETETLNVRSEPSVDSDIWDLADGYETYDVVEDLGDWIEIELDSSTGFVSAEYVRVKYTLNRAVKFTQEEIEAMEAQSLRGRVVSYALKWLGGKYVWGGSTLGKGVDCSGFTKEVYENFGIYMSHHSGTQASEGKKISRSQLRKGDLVFYAKGGRINHVAIYIGNNQVVHARSAKRGICITDMDYRSPVKFVTFIND